MPKLSKYKQEKNERLKRIARDLYKEGFSMREIGLRVGKSHFWSWQAVNEEIVIEPIKKMYEF